MNRFLSPLPINEQTGIALIRILVGIFMIYHGWETFDAAKIREYTTWDIFKSSSTPFFLVYMGKVSELVVGILLVLGLFTRLACIILILTMSYIAFIVGGGKIWYDDQYPFLFAVLAFVFIFTGPGRWSLDGILFNKKTEATRL
ncbi:MAG: DoxX family protein [Bacteroidetes bacterium]|nr:MAG: DoxX family protein [Bacteroidota bacterium]